MPTHRRLPAAAALAFVLLPAAAMAIEGDWQGTLVGTDGTHQEVVFRFDAGGRWVFTIRSRDGPRGWAIQRVGQTERWLLPGGGYGVLTVDELAVDRQRVVALLRFRLESALADGYLEQEISAMAVDFQQRGDHVQAVVRNDGTITRTSGLTGVREERIGGTFSGRLRR